jgi:hypothetical protein
MLKKYWNDPVWSKVISAGIIAVFAFIISLVVSWVKSISTGKTFGEQFVSFWTYKVDLWVFVPLIIVLLVIFYFVRRNELSKNKRSISEIPLPISSSKPTPSLLSVEPPTSRVLFDMNKADEKWFYGKPEFNYDTKGVQYGKKATGSYNFTNSILEIERSNTDGKYVIKLIKYISGEGTSNLIEKDKMHVGDRIVRISFSAKVSQGSHMIWFVPKRPGEHSWIGNTYANQTVASLNWSRLNLEFSISQNLDFEIYIQDSDTKNANTSLQIKDLIIQTDN